MSKNRKLPHVRQISHNSCGAACIEMIFIHWGIDSYQTEIFESIVGPNISNTYQNCKYALMALYLLDKGYPCMIAGTNSPLELLESCRDNDLEVILLHHRKRESTLGHSSVFSYSYGNSIYVNDPFLNSIEGTNKRYRYEDFLSLMYPVGPKDDIGAPNTFLIIANPCKEYRINTITCLEQQCQKAYPVIDCVMHLVDGVCCPWHDTWYQVEHEQ